MATTDILPYAGAGGANVDSQVTYAGHSYLTTGLANGAIVPAQFFNKILRQSSFMSAGLANWMVNRGINVPDDGNLVNLVAELQSATNAYLDKSIAGGTDVTLAVTTEANFPIIDLTGVITANINVIVPSAPGRWIFLNTTSGAFTVTVKTAAGTGVTVPSGGSASVFSDGVNVYSSQNGQLLNIQNFSTVGTFTYTKTPGTTKVIVRVQGGGGGGGGTLVVGAGVAAAAAGGGAGAYAESLLTSGFDGQTVVVGSGGNGGPNGGVNGVTGGTSSFGALISCTGGTGGTSVGAPVSTFPSFGASMQGGVATGGNLVSMNGQQGGVIIYGAAATNCIPGSGGNSFYGAAGSNFGGTGRAGNPGTGYGSGGGGALSSPSTGPFAGGAGRQGVVIVEEYS